MADARTPPTPSDASGDSALPITEAIDAGVERERRVAPPPPAPASGVSWLRLLREMAVPILAILTALILGGLIIMLTSGDFGRLASGTPLGELKVVQAYIGLIKGAFGSPQAIATTLVKATPYIFAGLAVALAFKCGLFNIGAEGQIALGALCSAFVGYSLQGVPIWIHLPLTLSAGVVGGALWGALPGALKAYTGAHEVITTIMFNYLALQFVQLMLSGPMKDKNPSIVVSQTPKLPQSAWLPMLIPNLGLHSGVILALAVAALIWFFLWKTTWGFEIRTVGANPNAARYAGISVARNIILAMAISGGLAGLGGAVEVTGVDLQGTRYLALGFSSGYGFDAIAVALLGRSHPAGVVAAALLFGALRAGTRQMQSASEIPGDIISVIQGLILLFVAADAIVRYIYRLRATPSFAPTPALTTGWGEKA
jgi:simple sugar transport system permease protein